MRTTVSVCIAFVVTCTSGSFVAAIRYMDPMSPQPGSNGDIGDKRMDLIEPSCDELRAMWRYTKRQSRAARGSAYSLYDDDSILLKVWQKMRERKAGPMYARGEFAKTRRLLAKFLLVSLAFLVHRTIFSLYVKSRYCFNGKGRINHEILFLNRNHRK